MGTCTATKKDVHNICHQMILVDKENEKRNKKCQHLYKPKAKINWHYCLIYVCERMKKRMNDKTNKPKESKTFFYFFSVYKYFLCQPFHIFAYTHKISWKFSFIVWVRTLISWIANVRWLMMVFVVSIFASNKSHWTMTYRATVAIHLSIWIRNEILYKYIFNVSKNKTEQNESKSKWKWKVFWKINNHHHHHYYYYYHRFHRRATELKFQTQILNKMESVPVESRKN